MSNYGAIPRRRFTRNRDRAVIAGVCAGLADYFGFNLRMTRILAVIALFMAMPVTLVVYFGTVLLVPASKAGEQEPQYRVEGRIEAYDLGLPKDLNHEFAGLEAEESVAKELDELKRRVSGRPIEETEVK